MTGYVEDGYVLDAFVAAAPENKNGPRLWESLEFSFRPATRMELVRHDAECRIASKEEFTDPEAAVKSEKLACEFVAKHLLDWDLKDSKGNAVPRTAEAIGRLHFNLFNATYRIIRGMQTSDPKPEQDKPPTSDEDQLGNSDAGSGSN